MQQKYRQGKERKKAGEEEREAGKRPGKGRERLEKMIIQAGKRGRARHGQKGWKRKVGK